MLESLADSPRARVLALFKGRRGARPPCFSGLVHVTAAGLAARGLRFSEIHADPRKMAAAAAAAYELFGFESAAVPTDLCVEASALGARVDFREDTPEPLFPIIARPLAASAQDLRLDPSLDVTRHPRVAAVLEALRLLRPEVGRAVVVGAWLPGPLTLALHVVEQTNLYADLARAPDAVARVLDALTVVLIQVGRAYRAAGADFITVHEMGGSPGVIGPRRFEQLLLPRLKRLIAALPPPRVLSVCGDTNRALPLLAAAGAEALSVDQTTRLARAREILGSEVLLFGNIDPVGVLADGTPAQVRRAAASAWAAGADAIWPGCDLPPRVPAANLRALVAEMKKPAGL